MRALALALIACGNSSGAAIDGGDARCADAAVCAGACEASFAGDFAETSYSAANCAGSALEFSIASQAIGSALAISIGLPSSPPPGTYSSETVASWTAVAARSIGDGGCVYSAGSDIVPPGSFSLKLAAAPPTAHGTLDVVLYVHALQATDCGPSDTETVEVVF